MAFTLNEELDKLLHSLKKTLKPNGYIFCLENIFLENQSYFAKKMIEMDIGLNVRTTEGYLRVFQKHFFHTQYKIRNDLMNIPYTHIAITAN